MHLCMTFPDITLYLKGIHLTLDSWRKDRQPHGWKVQNEAEWLQFLREKNYNDVNSDNWRDITAKFKGQSFKDTPKRVQGVSRLEQDLRALSKLLGKTLLQRG